MATSKLTDMHRDFSFERDQLLHFHYEPPVPKPDPRKLYYHQEPTFRTTHGVEPIDRILEKIEYKPNVRFRREGHLLCIEMQVPERSDPETITSVMSRQEIPDNLRYDDDYALRGRDHYAERVCDWVRRKLLEFEQHEMDEWFKFEGRRTHDPHMAVKLR